LFDNLALGRDASEGAWEDLRSKVEAGLEARISAGKWFEVRRALEKYLEVKSEIVSLQEMADSPGQCCGL
jgi:hypothetical protein